VERALISSSLSLRALAVVAYVLACASALPALRPWEYFNEFAGGTQNAYKYFDDEGVDLGQRSKELVAYYRQFLKPTGEMAYVIYGTTDEELKGRDVEFLGRDLQRDRNRLSQPEWPEQCSVLQCPRPAALIGISLHFAMLSRKRDSGI
jgi:hypothetical protein